MGVSVPSISLTFAGVMQKHILLRRPIADGSGGCAGDYWTPSTITDNYLMIDEEDCDNEATYLYYEDWDNVNILYGTQWIQSNNVVIPSGSIVDYVKTVAIVQHNIDYDYWTDFSGSPFYQPSYNNPSGYYDGYFKLLLSMNSCVTQHLTSEFALHYYTMESLQDPPESYYSIVEQYDTNPDTGLAWTENEINDCQFGIAGKPPTLYSRSYWYGYPGHSILTDYWDATSYPTLDFHEHLTDANASTYIYKREADDASYATHFIWFGIDETDSIFVAHQARGPTDYTTDDTVLQGDRIWHIGMWITGVTAITGTVKFKPCMAYKGEIAYGAECTVSPGSPQSANVNGSISGNFSNPTCSFEELISDVSFGFIITSMVTDSEIRFGIGSCYLQIGSWDFASDIRCTQLYQIVSYSDAIPSPCYLPKPIDIRVNQNIDTMGLNFASGNREVYALSRADKNTILSGLMWDGCTDGTTTCEELIDCIRDLAKYKEPITIAGLRYSSLCTDYNIISFGWTQVSECPNSYEWNLELEFVD